MKVLVLSPHFAPRFEGGTEIVARAQARELLALGAEVQVLAGCDTPHRGQDLEHESVDGLRVSFLPRLEEERYDLLLERPRILELVRHAAEGADVVHLHGWSTLAGNIAHSLCRDHKVVLSLHDLFVTCPRFFRLPHPVVDACPEGQELDICVRCVQPDAPGLPSDVLMAGLEQRVQRYQAELDGAAAVVFPSASQQQRIGVFMRLESGRCHVIPHGLCRSIKREGAQGEWSGSGPLRILHLGNLTAAKGVLELAQAAAIVASKGLRIEVVFAGKSVQEGIEARLGELGGSADLRFLGSFDGESLAPMLKDLGGCHLAVLPSRAHESYGLVVDEALALGLPTWVSDRGAPRERIGKAGRVIPAEDSQALAENLLAVHRDPKSLQLERAALPRRVPDAAQAALDLQTLFLKLID